MQLALSSNTEAYAASLFRYADETGKTISEALAREGPDFRLELFHQFRDLRPSPESLLPAAQSRGWRMRRLKSTALVPMQAGLSQRTIRRALEILGGRKSDYFRWIGSRLAPVRISARKDRRIVRGGRSGRRFSKSVLHADQLSATEFANFKSSDDFRVFGPRRLNARALANYLEWRFRQRAAQGGTMAIQWLFKTWQRNGHRYGGRLVQRSATGIPIGTVDFDVSGEILNTIIFNGYVPGTGAIAEKTGVLDKVFAVRAPKLLNAIQMHHAKVARQHNLA